MINWIQKSISSESVTDGRPLEGFMAAFPKLWYTYHLWYAKDSQVVRLPSRNLIYFFININECKIQSFSLNFIKIKILHNNFDLLCLFLYCYHTLLLVSRSMWVLDLLHLLHQLRAPVQVNRKFAKKCKSQPIQNRIYWSKNVTQHGKSVMVQLRWCTDQLMLSNLTFILME